MTRRKLFATSITMGVASLLTLASCTPSSAPAMPDLAGREVKIALENDYPPFNCLNATTGQPEGWDYDVIGELARRLNFKPVYVTVPFAQTIDAVAAGTYDMAGDGISITYERAQKVAYSQQYMIVRQRLVIRTGESRFTTLVAAKDNAALLIGAKAGTTNYATAASYFGSARVQTYASLDEAVQALLAGTVAGVVMDDVTLEALQGTYPNQLARLTGVLYADLLGFIFPLTSDLVAPVNQALTAMQKDGSLQALNAKWIPVQ